MSVTLEITFIIAGLLAESGDESELNAEMRLPNLLLRVEKDDFKVVKIFVIVFGSCGSGGCSPFATSIKVIMTLEMS